MKREFGQKLFYTVMAALLISLFVVSCKKEEEIITPIAAFDFDTESDIPFGIPLKVTFTDATTKTIDGVSYMWDFGDGAGTSTEQDPVYTYENGGEYTVTMTVSNAVDKKDTYTEIIELTSQIVGTWYLDSLAASTVDTLDVLGGMEFGNKAGWDGAAWTASGDEGFSPFWSNVIFAGNYFGRKMFFANRFSFTADGVFKRELVGDQFIFWAGEQTLSESVDWTADDETSLNGYKSSDAMSWTMSANSANSNTAALTLTGDANTDPWLGIYFAGNENIVGEVFNYVVSVVNDNQLIVSGTSNLFPPDNVFVLKFARAQQ